MAVLICDATDCKHGSKRPLRSWKTQSGGKCYGCALKYAVVSKVFDPDGDIEAVAGKMAACSFYEPMEKDTLNNDEEGDNDA